MTKRTRPSKKKLTALETRLQKKDLAPQERAVLIEAKGAMKDVEAYNKAFYEKQAILRANAKRKNRIVESIKKRPKFSLVCTLQKSRVV